MTGSRCELPDLQNRRVCPMWRAVGGADECSGVEAIADGGGAVDVEPEGGGVGRVGRERG